MSHFMQQQKHSAGDITKARQQGFSLIEFMVASAISMIVLLAAGSTYFTTWQLKQKTQAKVSFQQDMREAGNLIRRDLRQAGSFGCLNTPKNEATMNLFGNAFDEKHHIATSLPTKNTIPGITVNTSATPLMIIYGDQEVQSSIACNTDYIKKDSNDDKDKIDNHINAVAYIVGHTSLDDATQNNLYRVVFNQGKWGAAQMVAENVDNMSNKFQYISAATPCPKNKDEPAIKIKLDHLESLRDQIDLPILAETTLTHTYIDDKTKQPVSSTYIIDTMVQKGNICLSQSLISGNH